jgi:hypothetical protein
MRKIKLIPWAIFLAGFIFFSCKKETKTIYKAAAADSAYISITNASPSISNLLFYVDNNFIPLPDSPFSFGSTTYQTYINNGNEINPIIRQLPYIKIPTGYDQLRFNSESPGALFSTNGYFISGASYSVFITDSVAHGQAKCILLQDLIGNSDITHGQLRFINLSPDAPPLDLYAYSYTTNDGYKLIFSNSGYLPNDYSSTVNAQTFKSMAAGPYDLVVSESGTSNALLAGGLMIDAKGVTTIYTRGFVNGTGANTLDVGIYSFIQQ